MAESLIDSETHFLSMAAEPFIRNTLSFMRDQIEPGNPLYELIYNDMLQKILDSSDPATQLHWLKIQKGIIDRVVLRVETVMDERQRASLNEP